MPFKVKINNGDEIIVDEGNTILESALDQGIDFPHGCRTGNCGACKSKKIYGEIEMSPFSEFALDQEEEKQSLILACRSVPWSDCEIEILNEDDENDKNNIEIKNLKCEVINIKKVTKDIFIINLKLNDKNFFEFKAGQYAELYIGDCKEKHFSMANSPNTNELEFHINTFFEKRSLKDLVKNN